MGLDRIGSGQVASVGHVSSSSIVYTRVRENVALRLVAAGDSGRLGGAAQWFRRASISSDFDIRERPLMSRSLARFIRSAFERSS